MSREILKWATTRVAPTMDEPGKALRSIVGATLVVARCWSPTAGEAGFAGR